MTWLSKLCYVNITITMEVEMKIDPDSLDARDVHELMVGCVTPRPIAFVSTIGADGVYNVAPFSFVTLMSMHPAVVGFAIGRRRGGSKKDTLVNIEFSRDFVINIVSESIAQAMNQASGDYPSDVDEFKEAGLTPLESDRVRPPRVAESPIHLECRLMQVMEFGAPPRIHNFVVGEILRIHVRDDLVVDGAVKADRLNAIGRLGEDFYCRTRDIFEMKRPAV
jgi:flavin reductase (DIM6/NTAB) family NADH-FMN oxidoreductase RutF